MPAGTATSATSVSVPAMRVSGFAVVLQPLNEPATNQPSFASRSEKTMRPAACAGAPCASSAVQILVHARLRVGGGGESALERVEIGDVVEARIGDEARGERRRGSRRLRRGRTGNGIARARRGAAAGGQQQCDGENQLSHGRRFYREMRGVARVPRCDIEYPPILARVAAVTIDELSWLAALRPDERERAASLFHIEEFSPGRELFLGRGRAFADGADPLGASGAHARGDREPRAGRDPPRARRSLRGAAALRRDPRRRAPRRDGVRAHRDARRSADCARSASNSPSCGSVSRRSSRAS